MDREAWWATVHGVTKSWTQLSDFTHFYTYKWQSKHSELKYWLLLPPQVLAGDDTSFRSVA